MTRREFLDVAIATTFIAGVGHSAWAVETKGGIPYRTLGRTGEKVSIVGLGGYHLGKQADEQLYKTSHHFDGTYQNPQWLE